MRWHMLSVLLGIRVLARINPDPARVTDAIGMAIQSLGLPPLALAMFTENHCTESM
jgi:TetR/AcrR family transcriptional repressor of nem operon